MPEFVKLGINLKFEITITSYLSMSLLVSSFDRGHIVVSDHVFFNIMYHLQLVQNRN